MKWTETHIQQALCFRFFNYQKNLCIPNVNYGFDSRRGEKDLLVISSAWYLTEVEIKVDARDLLREALKDKHQSRTVENPYGPLIKRYYIAAPEEVWTRAFGKIPLADAGKLPMGAGRISISLDRAGQPWCRITQPCATNRSARPLTSQEMIDLLRLAYFRIWNRNDFTRLFPFIEYEEANAG